MKFFFKQLNLDLKKYVSKMLQDAKQWISFNESCKRCLAYKKLKLEIIEIYINYTKNTKFCSKLKIRSFPNW